MTGLYSVPSIVPTITLGSHEIRPIHSAPSLGQSIVDLDLVVWSTWYTRHLALCYIDRQWRGKKREKVKDWRRPSMWIFLFRLKRWFNLRPFFLLFVCFYQFIYCEWGLEAKRKFNEIFLFKLPFIFFQLSLFSSLLMFSYQKNIQLRWVGASNTKEKFPFMYIPTLLYLLNHMCIYYWQIFLFVLRIIMTWPANKI